MKKINLLILLVVVALGLSACQKENHLRTLRIYNWQDYIDDGSIEENGTSMLDDFKEYYKKVYGEEIEIVYDTFETNESMFNTLKTGKTTYDLVCPSEYMIQRMIKADMLEKYDSDGTPNYKNYASPYIVNLFEETNLNEYARCYMWGTLGLVYNPEYISLEDVSSWDAMWNPEYKGKVSTKDSIRDTYVVGVMHAYQDELNELRTQYLNSEIDAVAYNKEIVSIMNRCDDQNIKDVLKELQSLKPNLFGFEVDSGKTDIVSGKIYMNLAWSGDAVYSMLLAEEEDNTILEYSVPLEGSNIWFDGWVMPKGADKELAQCFVDFLSMPKNAARNMEMIGYTSAIAGNEIFELVVDWYDETYDDFTLLTNQNIESIFDLDQENVVIGLIDNSDEYESIEEYQAYLSNYLFENAEIVVVNASEANQIDLSRFDGLITSQTEDEEALFVVEQINGLIEDSNKMFDLTNSIVLSYLDELYEYDLTYFFEGTLDDEINPLLYTSSLNGQLYTQYPDQETVVRCSIMQDFEEQNNKVIEMWTSVKAVNLPTWATVTFFVVVVFGIILVFVIMQVNKKMHRRFKK